MARHEKRVPVNNEAGYGLVDVRAQIPVEHRAAPKIDTAEVLVRLPVDHPKRATHEKPAVTNGDGHDHWRIDVPGGSSRARIPIRHRPVDQDMSETGSWLPCHSR